MTTRIPVSSIQNSWNDAQRVDKGDMDTEQTYNSETNAAIVNNFKGSGVLPENPIRLTLFDSDDLTSDQASLVASNDFDGQGIDIHNGNLCLFGCGIGST